MKKKLKNTINPDISLGQSQKKYLPAIDHSKSPLEIFIDDFSNDDYSIESKKSKEVRKKISLTSSFKKNDIFYTKHSLFQKSMSPIHKTNISRQLNFSGYIKPHSKIEPKTLTSFFKKRSKISKNKNLVKKTLSTKR